MNLNIGIHIGGLLLTAKAIYDSQEDENDAATTDKEVQVGKALNEIFGSIIVNNS